MEQNIKNKFTDLAIQMEKDVKYDQYSDREIINKWTTLFLNMNNEFRGGIKQLTLKELYADTLSAVINKSEGNLLFDAVPSGLVALDRIIGGFPVGELTVIGARPAMGKTAFLLTVLANSIVSKNDPIAFFSLENSSQSIMLRLMSIFSHQSTYKIVTSMKNDLEKKLFMDTTKTIEDANLEIVDDCFTMDDIVSRTHFLVEEKGVKLIIIDYLQLIQTKSKMNREQEIAKICRELKAIARKYNVAIFVSSQLSRSVEMRGGDRRPQLSDLRESGAIEQDADKVIFLHRPEYYNVTEDELGESTIGIAEFIVAKNRGGAVDSAKVRFVGQCGNFQDFDSTSNFHNYDTLESFKNIRSTEFLPDFPNKSTDISGIDDTNPF
jgi:replicative DNA helicase